MSFKNYTDCLLRAFLSHNKPAELVKRKQEILTGVAGYHNYTPNSVLYVGFNPAILAETSNHIAVTCISDAAMDYLSDSGIAFKYIPYEELHKYHKTFDSVVALDEFFTFAKSADEQKDVVTLLCNLALEYVITTCKDYKNQEFKDREFSVPALVRGAKENNIFLEFHDYDLQDRNSWNTTVYQIANANLHTEGPFPRKMMFFKQLAKFSSDAGAVGFSIHKNMMYKSLIKKNYEHVISIRFDNNGS